MGRMIDIGKYKALMWGNMVPLLLFYGKRFIECKGYPLGMCCIPDILNIVLDFHWVSRE